MSRNSQTRPFNWKDLARQSAERFGFHHVGWPLAAGSFGQGGEVSPHAEIRFQRVTTTEVAPAAFVGVYAEAFEREWGERLKRTSLPPRFEESPPFVLHALNIDELGARPWVANKPSGQDVAEMRDYLARVFSYATTLPSSFSDLVKAIEARRIGGYDIGAYLGHPFKVRGFVEWLQRERNLSIAESVLPLLSDRVGPYDVAVMLAP
jgi:hypothetical protein